MSTAPSDIGMRTAWHGIAARTRALSQGETVAEEVRCTAAAALDLLQLVATWPLPRRSCFRIDLAASLFDLCATTGEALCAERHCAHEENPAARACRVVACPEELPGAIRLRSGA